MEQKAWRRPRKKNNVKQSGSPKPKSIDDYIAASGEANVPMLQQLREAIRQAAPKATEVISYGMPAFRQNKVLVYFAINKNHLGFYPTAEPIQAFKKELKEYTTSKGAIHFPLDKPLPIALIKRIVKFRVAAGQ